VSLVTPDSEETIGLLARIASGDAQGLESLLARFRPGLRAFIDARLDAGLRSRLDPSDIVQDTQMELVRRMPDFLKRRPMPFHLWIRKKAYERLLNLRRDHRRTLRRSVEREISWNANSSLMLAKPLLASGPTPSEHLQAREFAERVAQVVEQLPEGDREILLMRHVEESPYEEIGCLLDIEPAAARKRYGRALLRLRKLLGEHGLLESPS
jgi:RNA polymerase sigma-70 factor (ECF subfamily)